MVALTRPNIPRTPTVTVDRGTSIEDALARLEDSNQGWLVVAREGVVLDVLDDRQLRQAATSGRRTVGQITGRERGRVIWIDG